MRQTSTLYIFATVAFSAAAVVPAAGITTENAHPEATKPSTTAQEEAKEKEEQEQQLYGVDVSFPMHHPSVSTNYLWLPHNRNDESSSYSPTSPREIPREYQGMAVQPLGDRQSFYQTFVERCREYARTNGDDPYKCDRSEEDRIRTILNQPKAMQNFTESGYLKIRAPTELMSLLTQFWNRNVASSRTQEKLKAGQTITNDFDVPTQMVNINDLDLPGGGRTLRKKIWDAASDPVRKWTGQETLVPSSLYGIRIYQHGAILTPHVDRLPLISSAIINVAQDVDEDWPLEVIDHGGVARNITMEPGDMVLYESHSIIHGRPFPLRGRYYANVFIHFMPSGDDTDELPIYLVPNSPQARAWTERVHKNRKDEDGRTPLHHAAEKGDLKSVQRIIAIRNGANNNDDDHVVNEADSNGWRPLHEAARAGNVDVARYLLDHGALVNARTSGTGGTPLHWAMKGWDGNENGDIVRLLKERGGIDLPPKKIEADEYRRTILHAAARDGDLKLLREVVPSKGGTNHVNDEDINGWRPLHEASRLGHTDVARYLLDRGADINARTWQGKGGTALYYATWKHGSNHLLTKLLVERGAVLVPPVA